MIFPPPSPTVAAPRTCIPGKPHAKSENPPLSPKRSLTQHEEDQLSHLELKCRHMHPETRPTPLNPWSASDLSASYHSLATSTSAPDLGVVRPEQPLRPGSGRVPRSATTDAPVYSWPPPPIPTPGPGRSSHSNLAGQRASLHGSGEKTLTRGAFLESIRTWHPPTDPSKPARTSENVLQPIRARTGSMPSVRRPPEGLWRSDAGMTRATHEIVDPAASLACHTPPGLPPRRPELRRSSSVSDLPLHGSLSLSLALGSQPLRASEHTKAVPPIGAERSRVVSITSCQSHVRNSPTTEPNGPLLCSPPHSPRLVADASHASTSKKDLERLLCHAIQNKYSPKIISPLSPLRTATPAFDLSADPAYQVRMPSQSNTPSPRYSKCPPGRARTVCEGYQSVNWDTTCMHCQECQRDTVRKRLLALRYRHRVQRNNTLHACPPRGTNASVANCMREVFAYEMDEEEKSLWEEVAAVTGSGAGPLSFSRVSGVSCGAGALQWRGVDNGNDDGMRDDCVEMSDDCPGLLANASAGLFRDVSVY